jgi:hypothetical protein
MKFFLLIGGLSGFVLTFAASLHAGNAPAFALRDAAIGCFGGAMIFRVLHFVVMATIRSHIASVAAEAEAQREAASKQTS